MEGGTRHHQERHHKPRAVRNQSTRSMASINNDNPDADANDDDPLLGSRSSAGASMSHAARLLRGRAGERPKRKSTLLEFMKTSRQKSMTQLNYKEKLTMSPIQKCQKYARFPFKLVTHVLIAILATTYVIFANLEYASYMTATTETFRKVLFQVDSSDIDPNGVGVFHTIEDIQKHQRNCLTRYFSYHRESVGQVKTLKEVEMVVYPLNHSAPRHYIVDRDDMLGPFNNSDISNERAYFDTLGEVHFHYQFNNTHQSYLWSKGKIEVMRFAWDITAVYDFSIDIVAKYQIYFVSRPTTTQIIGPELSIIDGCTLVLCFFSLFLIIRALWKSFKIYLYARRQLSAQNVERYADLTDHITWSKLTLLDHLAFFNLWLFMSGLANISLIIGCSVGMYRIHNDVQTRHSEVNVETFTRGIGAFLSWFSLIRYLEFDTQFYLLILSIRAALSRVVKFIIMCIPLYMGYALVGVFCLSDHDDFATFFNSLRTLFALLNGDSILLEYQTLCDDSSVAYCLFAQFYLYTFCVLFITTVLNVFIFIVEDGFHLAKSAAGRDETTEESSFKIDHERLRKILDAADAVRGINLEVLFKDSDDDEAHMPVDTVGMRTPKRSKIKFPSEMSGSEKRATRESATDFPTTEDIQESVIKASVGVVQKLLQTESTKKLQDVVLREGKVLEAEKLLLDRERAVDSALKRAAKADELQRVVEDLSATNADLKLVHEAEKAKSEGLAKQLAAAQHAIRALKQMVEVQDKLDSS